MNTTKLITGLAFLALIMLVSTDLVAQPGPPNNPTPFGFVELLIGAGAVYGAKKVHDKKKGSEAK